MTDQDIRDVKQYVLEKEEVPELLLNKKFNDIKEILKTLDFKMWKRKRDKRNKSLDNCIWHDLA